jgi:phenylpyruvate tautomerase PptA (4-oxalocrotonate tautomerase family)
MPLVRIEIVKGRTAVDKKQLLEGVHAALVEAFEIPDDDRTQRIIEHDPSNFEIPPGGGERAHRDHRVSRQIGNREAAPLRGDRPEPGSRRRSGKRHLRCSPRITHGELGVSEAGDRPAR